MHVLYSKFQEKNLIHMAAPSQGWMLGMGKHLSGGGGARQIWLKHVNFMFTLIISMHQR